MNTRPADYVLLSYFGLWLLFGLVVLSSAGVAVGLDIFKDPYFFIRHQLLYGVLPGLALFFICARINYDTWRKLATPILGFTILLLILVLIPGIGTSFDKGARSWFNFFGATFQPAEALKLTLVIFFSAYLVGHKRDLPNFQQGFLVALGVAIMPIVLVLLQPDVGTAAILFGVVFLLLYLAGAKLSHLLLLLLSGLIAFAGLIAIAPYRLNRLMTFLHPELDPQGIGYQINQGFLAVGSGGWMGLGLGHSRQKFQYLPEVQADSIFAILAEEMGFIIATGFIVLLILVVVRGFKLARHAPDDFSRLLVSGILVWFMIQSFLNIGAMVGLLPLTGVPLPLVSHGGSALIMSMAAVGIIMNVSKYSKL